MDIYHFLAHKFIYSFLKMNRDINSEYARYIIECWLVNISKITIVYLCSFLFHTLIGTFVLHISFLVIRYFSYGWHASKNIFCTGISIFLFVVLPKIFTEISISLTVFIIMAIVNISLLFIFAPASSEIKQIQVRKVKKIGATISALLLILISLYLETIQIFILSGITMATFFVVVNILLIYKDKEKDDDKFQKKPS